MFPKKNLTTPGPEKTDPSNKISKGYKTIPINETQITKPGNILDTLLLSHCHIGRLEALSVSKKPEIMKKPAMAELERKERIWLSSPEPKAQK